LAGKETRTVHCAITIVDPFGAATPGRRAWP
jgi:hypothetical protein